MNQLIDNTLNTVAASKIKTHRISSGNTDPLVFQSSNPKFVLLFSPHGGWPASLQHSIAFVLEPYDGPGERKKLSELGA